MSIPFAEFLRGGYLERGDIVLIRRKDSWLSRLIATGTGSLFSHCALMFLVPGDDREFSNAFILESTTTGVGVANLGAMAGMKGGVADFAIKRFEAPWFDDMAKREVRGRMLNHVHAPYDYGTALRIAATIMYDRVFGLQEKIARRRLKRIVLKERKMPRQFICGGFIQYGFLDLAAAHGASLESVAFNERLRYDRSNEAILSTTPEDLARSPLLRWKFAARNGVVWPVNSKSEAEALLRGQS